MRLILPNYPKGRAQGPVVLHQRRPASQHCRHVHWEDGGYTQGGTGRLHTRVVYTHHGNPGSMHRGVLCPPCYPVYMHRGVLCPPCYPGVYNRGYPPNPRVYNREDTLLTHGCIRVKPLIPTGV